MKEEEIVRLLRERREEGMQALLTSFGPLLRYLIAPILPEPAEQEECLNLVLLRVWEKIDRYDSGKGSFRTWLTVIARNSAVDQARKNRRETVWLPEEYPDPGKNPEDEILARERRQKVRECIASLSAGDRELVFRRYYYQQSLDQIAAEMRLSVRGAEGRLYRIRRRLKEMLGGEWDV